MFKLKVMKGTLNEYDLNDRFGMVAFADNPGTLSYNSLTLVSNDRPN
jgi:hypothetical protein